MMLNGNLPTISSLSQLSQGIPVPNNGHNRNQIHAFCYKRLNNALLQIVQPSRLSVFMVALSHIDICSRPTDMFIKSKELLFQIRRFYKQTNK